MINANILQLINTPTENAPTISRFVEEYFSDLVPDSNYFAHLVRYDDTEVATTPTKPEELLARLPHASFSLPRYFAVSYQRYPTRTPSE